MGNLQSVYKALQRLTSDICVSNDISDIEKSDKIVLPGVGQFKSGMRNIRPYVSILRHKVFEQKTPILGICLGMQLLTKFSEEGNVDGLGWINANTKKFMFSDKTLKIPHIGWNTISIQKKDGMLLKGILEKDFFYFAHSYYIMTKENNILCSTKYGIDFVSGIEQENILATQFHPEKSLKAGMKILENFIKEIKKYINDE